MSDGRFGDLVALDPRTGERHILTRDDYYDDHPSWGPEGRYILFASKRHQNPLTRDMGAPDHIYRLDLSTGRIRIWGRGLTERFEAVADEMGKPAVSPSGSKVAFATYPDTSTPWGRIVIYDQVRDSVRVVADSVTLADRITWSADGRYLAFSAVPYGMAIQNYALFVVDLQSGKVTLMKKDEHRYTLGDLYGGRMLYKHAPDIWEAGSVTVVETADPEFMDSTRVYRFDARGEVFDDPVYAGRDSIYVLVRDPQMDAESYEMDICVQDLTSSARRCLTGEPRSRNGLRILR
jgi:Tol biopolymer transport system component